MLSYGASAADASRFLGRIGHGSFKGNSSGDTKKRPEGWRIKFTIKRVSIKMDDKESVLRIGHHH